jgi:hypothetical protein
MAAFGCIALLREYLVVVAVKRLRLVAVGVPESLSYVGQWPKRDVRFALCNRPIQTVMLTLTKVHRLNQLFSVKLSLFRTSDVLPRRTRLRGLRTLATERMLQFRRRFRTARGSSKQCDY